MNFNNEADQRSSAEKLKLCQICLMFILSYQNDHHYPILSFKTTLKIRKHMHG